MSARRPGPVLGLFGAVVMAVLAALLPASAGARSASGRWQLVDYHQAGCFSPNVHDTWFGIYVQGRWKHQLDIGASELPAGGTYSATDAPVPAGRSDGEH